uniref:Unclassified n=3 Tax=Fusarium pseudograminearum TaxID=101028 RepID=W1ICT9_FUSPS|nr:unclassified [Fusarium pseudograminearum CS3427]CDL73198.1 unclassified [Fusarium pseudograminearum CS3487]CDL73293.1 unclassified [Fusarium pseudograminearum CS5834]CDX48231.1 unclassified [Fusarium pseudograminearum CS5834]CDX48323.1 unclassified [Fusarium pseudograminearum CS3487]
MHSYPNIDSLPLIYTLKGGPALRVKKELVLVLIQARRDSFHESASSKINK